MQSLSEHRCWRLNDLEIAGRKLSGIGAAALVPIISDDEPSSSLSLTAAPTARPRIRSAGTSASASSADP